MTFFLSVCIEVPAGITLPTWASSDDGPRELRLFVCAAGKGVRLCGVLPFLRRGGNTPCIN